jgi:Secretion system C-terminal sorting domain
MKKILTSLVITLFCLPFVVLAQGGKSNAAASYLGPSNVPYTSTASNVGVTVDAADVPTLNNTSYDCNGQKFDCSAMAWWLKSAQQSITVRFSEPVSSFTLVVNGTNKGEVFTITPSTGKVTLSDFCNENFETVAANQLIDVAEEATGTSIVVNNAVGATSYTISHNGVGNGSRLSIPDRFVPEKAAAQAGAISSIYPNPTSGRFEVRATGTVGNLEVVDMLGRHVTSMPFDTQVSIDLSNQAPGVYWVKITDQKQQVSMQRIVRQ